MPEGHDIRSELSEIASRAFRVRMAIKNKAYVKAYSEIGKLTDYVRDVQYVHTGEMEIDNGDAPF